MTNSINKCSIIGLGKLGACMAAAMASKKIKVIGFDRSPAVLKKVVQKEAPIFEPGLQGLFARYSSRILATSNIEFAIRETDATFIVVPTPSKKDGSFCLDYIVEAAKMVGEALSKKKKFHLVVITSTVLPGDTDKIIRVVEKNSGKTCGEHFGVCYSPEFIALGTVVKNFLNPDFVLIGESDKQSGRMLERFYKKICENKPFVSHLNFANAELVKIAVNTFVTMKITFANMLGQIAENIPGGDIDFVTETLGLDTRIGKRYLKGGLGYGGPCFPRDNEALACVAKRFNVPTHVPQATDSFNHSIIYRLTNVVKTSYKKNYVVGILGLSYKSGSNVLEESQGVMLAEALIECGIKVILYDPLAMGNLKKKFGNSLEYAKDAKNLINKSNIIVIANQDPEFSDLDKYFLRYKGTEKLVIDCWRIMKSRCSRYPKRIKFIFFGMQSLR